jgi:hypothetical protein
MALHLDGPGYCDLASTVIYFSRVGTKLGLVDFVWLVQSTGYDMTRIASMANVYHERNLFFYIEFKGTEDLHDFSVKHIECNEGALKSETGGIFIPIDIGTGEHIVTLLAVKSTTTDYDLINAMLEYGDIRAVHRGFHYTGENQIDNGKRYVVFSGHTSTRIPSSISIQGFSIPTRQYNLCKQTPSADHNRTVPGSTSQLAPEMECVPSGVLSSSKLQVKHSDLYLTDISLAKQVHKSTQTEKQPKCSRNQQVEAKPKCRHFATMVSGVNRVECGTNTVHPVLVDTAVQRNYHTKKKNTQTDVTEMQDAKVQCQVAQECKNTQTQTLKEQVKELRQMPKRANIISRKRKRTLSGPQDLKSKQMTSQNIKQYFKLKRPKVLNQPSLPSTPSGSLLGNTPDFKFNFSPRTMSMDTFGAVFLWKLDKATNSLKHITQKNKSGEG